jgi:hypothetical protein
MYRTSSIGDVAKKVSDHQSPLPTPQTPRVGLVLGPAGQVMAHVRGADAESPRVGLVLFGYGREAGLA